MLIGLLHIFTFMSLIFYTLYFPYKYDKLLFILFLILCLHWVVLKGECLMSYLYKKRQDTQYYIGKNSSELKDIDDFSKEFSVYTGIDEDKINKMVYVLIYITFILLFYRFIKHKTVKPLYVLYLNFVLLFMYITYLKTNYRNHLLEQLYSVILTVSIIIICVFNSEKIKLKLFKK